MTDSVYEVVEAFEQRISMTIGNVAVKVAATLRRLGCSKSRWFAAAYLASCLLVISGYGGTAAAQEFRILSPAGSAPHPVVLLVPGCSGFATKNGINLHEERAAELRAGGYVVVFVDYIGRRMANNCGHISLTEVATDILEAAASLRNQSGVDAARIFVISWSYGGGGVLAALKTTSHPVIARAVMYYPVCRGAGPWPARVDGLMLLGGKDDIAYPELCGVVAKGVPAGRLRVVTYPEARHGFDMRGLPEPARQLSGAPAYNAEAAKESWAAVLEFLK